MPNLKGLALRTAMVLSAVAAVAVATPARGQDADVLTLDRPELAGISGMRPFWDRPVVLAADGATQELERGSLLKGTAAIWARDLDWHTGYNHWMEVADPNYKVKPRDPTPGAIAFDAVHRSLLVRFPGCAEAIAGRLNQGRSIAKVELVLPFRTTERLTPGYEAPSSFVGDLWDKIEPRWHATAWRLRRAWKADPATGPTYNGAVNGKASWSKYGAQDETHDRFPKAFGPAEVSGQRSDPIDVTAALTDPAYGATLADRLRGLEDGGFLVRKVEYYDMHFATPGYEWAAMTGGRAILVNAPRLVVTFGAGTDARPELALPPPADPAAGGVWQPTAVLPDAPAFAKLRETYAFRRPDWMPDWQWARAQELYALGGEANAFPDEERTYLKWVDEILRTPPRTWHGFQAADQLSLVHDFAQAFPAPLLDHLKLYWDSWLMPQRETWDCVHNQYHQIYTPWRAVGSDYVDRTGDWKGDKSFYRESYCRFMSTMNFNHTAAIGALLGGQFIGAERAIADGRYGLEMFPLRLWAWYDGTTQESIDHYYLAITMTDQKTFADYAPTAFDRLMGRSTLWKTMEELATCYHPGLKRYVSPAGRTTPFYATQVQEGVQHIAHVMTRAGALTDLDKIAGRAQEMRAKAVNKPPILGHDLSPRRVAMQAVHSPWAPEWMSEAFEGKRLPFEVTSTFRQWGAHLAAPKWKRSYLGTHYGLTSYDFAASPTINLQGLWKRTPDPIVSAADLGQLLIRFGYNRVNFIDTMKGGTLGNMGGSMATLQHRNKMIVLSSPNEGLRGSHFNPAQAEIKSLQTALCLFVLDEKPPWTVYVDGQEVTALPHACKAGSRIVIHDGVAFVGVIPLETTDLGRDAEVILKEGGDPLSPQSGEWMRESLLIENYFYRGDQRLDPAARPAALDEATGGFVVELADVTEYKDLAAFQKHLDAVRITQRYDPEAGLLAVACQSGDDRMEMGFMPKGADSDDHQPPSTAIPYRRVNGQWPYLAAGLERDTPISVLGRKGTIEKGNARLTLETNQMGYLVAEPESGTVLAANPLPDPTWFRLEIQGGPTIEADGRLGLAFVTVKPKTGTIDIACGSHPGQPADGLASFILVTGPAQPPTVTLNGAAPTPAPAGVKVDGRDVWLIPLVPGADPGKVTAASLAAARAEADKAFAADAGSVARLHYEKGEHYLLTKPSVGAWAFQRQWPQGVAFRAETPEGLEVAADGRLAFLQLVADTRQNRIELFAPRYLHDTLSESQKFDDKARALLVFGAAGRPTVVVNGRAYDGEMPMVEVDGRQAYIVPLYGQQPGDVMPGLVERYQAAMAKLPK
ncbi:MAG: hypothetical protein BWZ02_00110 [Lentisphaerae bacterium ADurb.BinA184]|nr:MAG: hypothetical protein BWZ02_00110 [Lentisphaerae bacterium ADurb.BinA184]